jgi:hypothetical protein
MPHAAANFLNKKKGPDKPAPEKFRGEREII